MMAPLRQYQWGFKWGPYEIRWGWDYPGTHRATWFFEVYRHHLLHWWVEVHPSYPFERGI